MQCFQISHLIILSCAVKYTTSPYISARSIVMILLKNRAVLPLRIKNEYPLKLYLFRFVNFCLCYVSDIYGRVACPELTGRNQGVRQ